MSREDRERQILAVARDEFSRRGYVQTSMDDIAEKVGVTKPVVYDRFSSKEGLLLACVRELRMELAEAVRAASLAARDPEDMVRQGARAFFSFVAEHEGVWRLLRCEQALSDLAREELEAIRRQQLSVTTEALRGHIGGGDPLREEMVAELFVGATERLALWAEQRADVRDHVADWFVDVMWNGLGVLFAGSPDGDAEMSGDTRESDSRK
ncbi:TetR/AcrR family transcriptional regulator [Streptomyces bohaiensis]|uniref:TetR/AcrR family transcriptional regulator n=1 Tax=Streptomyces bohaiensis TaxID=1431344 RepID=A0ABX1CBB2_9ACTN|nr:TetR/AcrR family transcriptional regulator [Streptomyces bohaiensis]NJQ14439.1 TetR/AcrR family transcriptional regulator [Streptomyces bohaiensis]